MGSVQFGKMMGSILGVDGGLPHALNVHRIAAVPLSLIELGPHRKDFVRREWSHDGRDGLSHIIPRNDVKALAGLVRLR